MHRNLSRRKSIRKLQSADRFRWRLRPVAVLAALRQNPSAQPIGGRVETLQSGRLHFLCGKMGAGKSTLSKQIAAREEAILLSQRTNCSTRCFLARWPTSVLSMSTRDGSRQRSPRTCAPCFPKACPSFSTSRPTRQSSAPGFGSCWTFRPGQPIPRARETTTRTSRALSASSFPDLASALDPRAPAAARRPPGRRA